MLVLQDGKRAGTGSLPLRLAASLQEVTATLVWKNEWSRSSACPPLQRSRQHKEQRCQLGSVSLGYGRAPLLCLSVTYCFPEDQPITEAAASWAASSSKASQQPLAQMIYPNGEQSPLTREKCSVGWGFLLKDGNCHTSFHRNRHLGAVSPADLEEFSRGVLLYSRGEAALLDGTESRSLFFQMQI